MGGFECSSHRRQDGRRLDLLAATGHDLHAEADYRRLQAHAMHTVRDGLRWHLIEAVSGRYDFSSFMPQLLAADRSGTQVIWDICHYGAPDWIDIWRPQFVAEFARFSAAVARVVRDSTDAVPFYCVVNEISFWSWAGGDHGLINPLARGRGLELKHQLVRAAIAATHAVREADPRARFIHVDPLIHVAASEPAYEEQAASDLRAQRDSWLMMSGELWPGLGGEPSLLDIVGLNHYGNNQWLIGGAEHGRTLLPSDEQYRPLHQLLQDAALRFKRPLMIAETGAEGAARRPWFDYVANETLIALRSGVPLEGVCLYPVLDYPGWADDRHCDTGLYGHADANGSRMLNPGLANAVANAGREIQRLRTETAR